jgi:hypothetical protein
MQHKYRLGQTVNLAPSLLRKFEVAQNFRVLQHMPALDGELEYLIKGVGDMEARRVKERELTARR